MNQMNENSILSPSTTSSTTSIQTQDHLQHQQLMQQHMQQIRTLYPYSMNALLPTRPVQQISLPYPYQLPRPNNILAHPHPFNTPRGYMDMSLQMMTHQLQQQQQQQQGDSKSKVNENNITGINASGSIQMKMSSLPMLQSLGVNPFPISQQQSGLPFYQPTHSSTSINSSLVGNDKEVDPLLHKHMLLQGKNKHERQYSELEPDQSLPSSSSSIESPHGVSSTPTLSGNTTYFKKRKVMPLSMDKALGDVSLRHITTSGADVSTPSSNSSQSPTSCIIDIHQQQSQPQQKPAQPHRHTVIIAGHHPSQFTNKMIPLYPTRTSISRRRKKGPYLRSSCVSCYEEKVKCCPSDIVGQNGLPGPCEKCVLKGRDCIKVLERKRGRKPKKDNDNQTLDNLGVATTTATTSSSM